MTVKDVRGWVDHALKYRAGKGIGEFDGKDDVILEAVLRAIANDPMRQDAHLLAQEALRIFE